MTKKVISLWAKRSKEKKIEILEKKIPQRILVIFRECIMELCDTDLTEEEIVLLFTPLFQEKKLPEFIQFYKIKELKEKLEEKKECSLSNYKDLLLGRFGWRIIQLKILTKDLPAERKNILTYYFCLILRTFA